MTQWANIPDEWNLRNVRRIIGFEGIDASGKTLQLDKLEAHLKDLGHRVCQLAYPAYGSFFGSEIGGRLSASTPGQTAAQIDAKSMALWYAMDRWEDYQQHRDAVESCDYLLLNRYTLSNLVYQSLRADDPEAMEDWIEKLEHEILGLPRPDLYLVMDVVPTVARANTDLKGEREYIDARADVYESDADLQTRARNLYRLLEQKRNDVRVIECATPAGMRAPEEIFKDILGNLENRHLL